MPLSDIATINVSTTGAGVTRAGYGVPNIVSHTAGWAERTRTYTSLSAVATDFAANTPEYLAAARIFGQSPKVPRIMISRAALQPTQSFTIGVNTVALRQPYKVRVAVPTGVVMPSQDAEYNSGQGATGWVASNTYSRGDLVMGISGSSGPNLYSCLGPSGAGYDAQFTGIGNGSMPSGLGSAIPGGGVYWMWAGSGTTGGITNDAVIQGVKARIEYLHAPTAIGTGSNQIIAALAGGAGSRTLTLTGAAAAKFFGLQVYSRAALSIKQDHADPGIATDLAAIKLESNSWYGLITLFNSEALVDAAAAWVESNTKLYAAATLDSAVATVAESSSATDVAHDIKAAAYARTFVAHHPSNDQFMDASEMGKFFPINPGGETWRMKTLSGVTVESYTDTEQTNMRAKYAHYYYDIGGRSVVGGDAKTGSGEYVDVTRFIDWYTSELQADLADLAIGINKIPFNNPGIALIAAKVKKRNDAGILAGGIAADPAPTVEVPDVNDVSTSDKTARELSGVTTEWTLAGAIHHITVSVTASA